ncbi:MAG TPA: NAD(P)-dependent oxidoreductase, partial [Phycisphaerae bacterium]|nr:NAD(P)-dependent oxidoreductase [Phycisphaerae bacterium]
AQSDVIAVHVPKNRETTGMIGVSEISRMKKGVILLNTARGGIIKEDALLEGLLSGHVAGAGIDTWDAEPPGENPFRDLPQVVMTPHIGASTDEAQMRVAECIGEQLPRALRGGVVDYPVNMPRIRMLEGGDVMTSYTVLAEKLGIFAAQFIDFTPRHLEISYLGSIARQDCTLLRLAFLKGYLFDKLDYVSYVNAEMRAASSGLQVRVAENPGLSQFESEIRFVFSAEDRLFTIGGVIFAGPHSRISRIDDFPFEVEPEGTFLAIRSLDRLGVVSGIASLLDEHGIPMRSFAFSHSDVHRRSMFLIRCGKDVPDIVLQQLRERPHITLVRRIVI